MIIFPWQKKFNIKDERGFNIVELIIVVGIISTLSGLTLPSFLNWIRAERVNAYTRELKEYLRIVRLEARRWGSVCDVKLIEIEHNSVPRDKNYFGFKVECDNSPSKINALIPPINNSIFQTMNNNYQITPNGRISSENSIIIVIGSQFYLSGAKILNCLIIQTPTGHIIKGKFIDKTFLKDQMKVSTLNLDNQLNSNQCES